MTGHSDGMGGFGPVVAAARQNATAPDQEIDEMDVPKREEIRLNDWHALPPSS